MINHNVFFGNVFSSALQGALLNQNEPPENALKFEGTEEYIFFEGDEIEQYITFETIE